MQNFFILATLTAAVHLASCAHEVVDCPDFQESCTCSVGQTECEFVLRVSLRLPFTSYPLGPDGNLLAGGIGVPYIVGSTGYRAAIRGTNRTCLFGDEVTLFDDEDFISRGCSPPITVDGFSTRNTLAINGITPGPTLVMDSGATVLMRVVNKLAVATSMHWHGMYQRRTAWMDGVGRVTEPSIQPGTSFTYIFKAQPRGTHWYHSHVDLQRVEGVYAAMVVRGPPLNSSELVPEEGGEAIIVDDPENNTMTIIDWYDESALDLFLRARSQGFTPAMAGTEVLNRDGTVTPVVRGVRADGSDIGPTPFFSALINGRGRFRNTITPLSEFTVRGGTYYLYRIVGAMDAQAQVFSMDDHVLRVIAADGKDIQFRDVEFINLEAGERYDFLVKADSQVANYWIRSESQQVNVPAGEEFSARAVLSYDGAPPLDWRNGYSNVPERRHNCTQENPCRVLNCPFQSYDSSANRTCISLVELVPRPMKKLKELPRFPPNEKCSDCMHFLNFDIAGPNFEFSVNARTQEFPSLPYQTNCGQYDRDNSSESEANTCEKNCEKGTSCKCIHVIPVANQRVYKKDAASGDFESIVMVFSSISSTGTPVTHPIHLHGHTFQVVHIGYGTYDENGLPQPTNDIVCNDPCTHPAWRDGVVPEGVWNRTVNGSDGISRVTPAAIQKDTVVIPAGGYVVVAFRANNPGYWYLHCHIEDHTHFGMVAIVQEFSPEQQWLPPPDINDPTGFNWTLAGFDAHLEDGLMCVDQPFAEAPTAVSDDADEVTISRAGFGVTLAVVILLAIACVILCVLLIAVCTKTKNLRSEKKLSPPLVQKE